MANTSSKETAQLSYENVLRNSYDEASKTLLTGTFIMGKVGHKITIVAQSATIDHVSYYDNATLLMTLSVTYDNAAHDNVLEVERIA